MTASVVKDKLQMWNIYFWLFILLALELEVTLQFVKSIIYFIINSRLDIKNLNLQAKHSAL